MSAYPVLAAEIAKRGYKKKAIARSVGMCEKAFSNKLAGRSPFTWPEVCAIRRQFFPDISPDELFRESGEEAS